MNKRQLTDTAQALVGGGRGLLARFHRARCNHAALSGEYTTKLEAA
jgi:hypothetical protein